MYAKWHFLPEHLSTAEARVDALDTWHDWATGKPVTQESLEEAVTTLHEIAAHEPGNGTRHLADVIHQWAAEHGVELARPPLQLDVPEPVEREPGFPGLGAVAAERVSIGGLRRTVRLPFQVTVRREHLGRHPAALREAQLDLLRGTGRPLAAPSSRGLLTEDSAPSALPGFSHPFYWAPFVLMGNWK